jgi:diacylglycerol kinase family enzyme
VSLLHNEEAGDGVSLDHIVRALERAGHEPVCVVENAADAHELLGVPTDLVVAAGGDGTVAIAARLLAGARIPLAILPLGTANNVANGFCTHGPIEELVERWRHGRRRALDLGVVGGSGERRHFVEAVGSGLIPNGIARMRARPPGDQTSSIDKLTIALRTFREILADAAPYPGTVVADGRRMTGSFLLIEVLNTRSVGPNIVLSPAADPSDGRLSVVVARAEDRAELDYCLAERLAGRDAGPPLHALHAARVELEGEVVLHVDDRLEPPCRKPLVLEIDPGAVEVLG